MSYTEQAKEAMLKKAEQKLKSAKNNFKEKSYDSCISDLYYAAFQTVVALLITRGDLVSKHTHVRAFVNRELARPGLIDIEDAKIYNKLMDQRSRADYTVHIFIDVEETKELVVAVEKFIAKIQILINRYDKGS